jgi:hypothetical protein
MPAPQASLFKETAKTTFRSKGIKLAVNWSQPTGDAGKQYVGAFAQSELNVAPDPMALFTPASTNRYHVDQCKTIGKNFADFIDDMSAAICGAWQQWMAAATFVGVMVNGPIGTITPGMFQGPPFFPLSFVQAPKVTPNMVKYAQAICQAINTGWQAWHMGFTGMLSYPPTFAAMAGPIHPPTPNIPINLAGAGASPGEALLAKETLKMAMVANLGDPMAQHHEALFDSVADAFDKAFKMFKTSTMINNVLAFGPIPTFAPPIVPIGPVVVGIGNGVPGACLT